ncbi:MAG: ferredoxin family protein [Rhodocyclaceae bacterium]|nr:ferredoxin family protein [Rhodocyclaceae bacterium]
MQHPFFNDLKQLHGNVHINEAWCKGCGFCVQFCPTNVLDTSPGFNAKGYHPPYSKNPGKCHDCTFCQTICPEFAIFVLRDADTEKGEVKK